MRRFQISIGAGLSLFILLIVALTAIIVHVPWSLTSRANIGDLDTRLNNLVIAGVGAKVDGLLDNAVAVRQALAGSLTQGVIDLDDENKREALFLSFLRSQPSLTAIEFGWADNQSFLVRRAIDGTIRVEETIPTVDGAVRRSTIYRPDSQGELVLANREQAASDYLVTQEFWYKTAFEDDNPVWSNIYRLPASGVFGVTTTQAIERNGDVIGVIGISISLDRLSSFLDGIEVSPHSSVFLTNIYDQLVAVQGNAPEMMARDNSPVRIPNLEQVHIEPVQVVAAALKTNNVMLKSLQATRQITYPDASTKENYFVTLAPLTQMGLIVSVVIPESDVLGAINRNRDVLLMMLAVFIIVILAASAFAVRRVIGGPLARVAGNLRELEDFRLDRIAAIPSSFSEIRQVSQATSRMAASLASFKKYIPTELVRTLFAQGIEAELGGELRELTILFMDLASFTQISERLGDRLIEFLGDYLSEMSTRIQSEKGTIDKYIGDAIMAFWGAPLPNESHALSACRAALACQARLREMRGAGVAELSARIGLNTGRVLVGNVGSHDRINYTVIGDPVNVASRLESLNKAYGTEILIGQSTYEEARDHIIARKLDRVAVYGKEEGLDMYELLALKSDAGADMLDWIALYERGLAAMHRRDWDGAIGLFREVMASRGGKDGVSALQIERAESYKLTPPPKDWDGLVVMESK